MTSELIVDVSPKQISMAVLEDGRLMELQRERRDLAFAVGDIYLVKLSSMSDMRKTLSCIIWT